MAALELVVNQLGVYFNHLASLSEDPTVKSVNRYKLNGYLCNGRVQICSLAVLYIMIC